MRFTKFHNDVFPLLGDMFRWKLGLTPRDHRTREERKAATVTSLPRSISSLGPKGYNTFFPKLLTKLSFLNRLYMAFKISPGALIRSPRKQPS